MKQLLLLVSVSFLSLQGVSINDIHRLNKTSIIKQFKPHCIHELSDALSYAQKNKLRIALASKKHSQGGQPFLKDGIVIDMSEFNRIIALDVDNKTITVEPGIDWKTIQSYINPYGLALRTMQHANCFSVGGSIAVNAHGPDLDYPMLIDSIQSLKVMLHDGTIIRASNQENSDLFKAIVGGYGVCGIVTEATLYLTDNTFLNKELYTLNTSDYIDNLVTRIIPNTAIHMHYGYLSVDPYNLFSKIHVVNCVDTGKVTNTRLPIRFKPHFKPFHNFWHKNKWVKKFQFSLLPWIIERQGCYSRNTLMNYSPTELKFDDPDYCHILQEYFIPIQNFDAFLKDVAQIIKANNSNLLTGIVRYLPENKQSLMSYAQNDCISVVFLFVQGRKEKDFEHTRVWTQKLIDSVLSYDGNFYLVSYKHATKNQVERGYHQIENLKAIRKKFDPKKMFSNSFVDKYFA